MLQQAVVVGERVFELMDGLRQQYGADDRLRYEWHHRSR